MSDDCSNNWGCQLAIINQKDLRGISSTCGESKVLEELKARVSTDLLREYVVSKVMACGSDANLFSVVELTEGDTSRCLIAAGSYVAGDSGPLQSWSTCDFSLQDGPSGIVPPSLVNNSFTKCRTIALPYAITGNDEDNIVIEKYEDDCITELHIRCMMAKMLGAPYKCILMELMLSSNGASLSDRALTMLGKLAEKHGLYIVLDEIMTGGRTNTMLMSTNKPKAFRDRVTHVTLGKWLQVGIVLVSSTYHSLKVSLLEHTTKRGVSTFIDCRQVLLYWNAVAANLIYADIRREMVISKLKVDKEASWGEGCLIFAPVRRNGVVLGTKNRFLPMLSIDTPIDSLHSSKMPEWSKEQTNKKIMEGVRNWLNFCPLSDNQNKQNRDLIVFLISSKYNIFKTTDWKQKVTPDSCNASQSDVLHRAEAAGLLSYVCKGNKRQRCWMVSEECESIINNSKC